MPATFLGVRHHSPACARQVAATIESLRPAYVLVEGPADVNARLDELLLGHELPIAIFSYYRDSGRSHLSWTPFCDYSPEWAAVTTGQACGAQVRFIDLPAWHPALAERSNRYADAEQRYAESVGRLCREFAVDNTDALWDQLFEIEPPGGLAERLAAYFDLLRGEAKAGPGDTAREQYMAAWVRAAVCDAGDRPVVVVTGGFHRPALAALAARPADGQDFPSIPEPADGAVGGSYLVPFTFRRLDAFGGYQSGMPSPGYYQALWEGGPDSAATRLAESVVSRLRAAGHPASTADLIAARSAAEGLARLRSHPRLSRTDVLDGLASALISDDLPQPLPWTRREPLAPGAHPAVAEMVIALTGDRTGRLHPRTPAPPLLRDVTAELERLGLAGGGDARLDLTVAADLHRSRVLHRLRALQVPGFHRAGGPATGADPVTAELWTLNPDDSRTPALIEAGSYGATLADAATARLGDLIGAAGNDLQALSALLFDTVLCGITTLTGPLLVVIEAGINDARELGPLGQALATSLGLWRHDRIFGVAGSALLATMIDASVSRLLWLAEGLHSGPGPADLPRLAALAAVRDAQRYAGQVLSIDQATTVAIAGRIAADTAAPPDLRGAAFGLGWALAGTGAPAEALRGVAGPLTLGDWLAGLFAVAREEVRTDSRVLAVMDELVTAMTDDDFLIGLPALRQAFGFFPPRDREAIAWALLDLRGLRGSARALLQTAIDPLLVAEGAALDERVEALLAREGLARESLAGEGPG